MSRHVPVTKAMEAQIDTLRSRGWSFTKIAHRLGVGYYAVRSRLDPAWRERMMSYYVPKRAYFNNVRSPVCYKRTFQSSPKLSWASESAKTLGDPAIGRSALDQRGAPGPRTNRFDLDEAERLIDSIYRTREDRDT